MHTSQENMTTKSTLTKDEISLLRSAIFTEEYSNRTTIKNYEYLLSLVLKEESKEQARELITNCQKKLENLEALSKKLWAISP